MCLFRYPILAEKVSSPEYEAANSFDEVKKIRKSHCGTIKSKGSSMGYGDR